MGVETKTFRNKMLRKNRLSAAIMTAIASATVSNLAFAQDDTPVVEEVLVTGIRASVQAAMDIKRDSAGVVDAISAEDIGKFPDTNLAESLQRITGVSIDRVNGEGSQITVRGFGPDFNMVTLNGRTLPGGSTYGGSSGADASTRGGNSRAFDFANLASEAVAGVQVYKTGKANITTGGIGATVNITTTRPLDNPGLSFTVAGKGVTDTTNRTGSDVTPELSGLVSWSDDEGKFGASLSASYQERDSGYTGATVNEWNTAVWGPGGADLYSVGIAPTADNPDTPADETDPGQNYWDDPVFVNTPAVGQLYTRPNDIRYAFSDRHRERTNAQLTLQFAPMESFTATMDYVFAENALEEQRGEITNWVQNAGNLSAVMFDATGDIAVPSLISENYIGDGNGTRDIGFAQQYRSQENTLQSIGLNLAWDVNEQLSLTFDAHNSEMESLPTGPGYAGELDVALGAQVKQGKSLYFGAELPSWSYDIYEPAGSGVSILETDTIDDCAFANANPGKEFVTDCDGPGLAGLDYADISSTVMRVFSAEQVSKVTQIQLGGTFEFDNGRFDFGFDQSTLETTTTSYNGNNAQVLGGWGASNPGEFPEGYIEPFNITGEFEDFSTGITPAMGFRADARELGAYLLTADQYAAQDPYIGVENNGRNTQSNSTIEEEATALFGQVALEGDLGGMEFNILAGLRFEMTDMTSESSTPPVELVEWQSDNDFQWIQSSNASATIVENDYDHLLPSLDLSLNVTDDIVARFSTSETIARPGLGNLNASVTGHGLGGSTLNTFIPTANGSNPYLVPLQSTNNDISVEWYFDDTSYASIGLWEKRVRNFIGTAQVDRTFGILDPTGGPRAQAALQALAANGMDRGDAWIFAAMSVLEPGTVANAEFGGDVGALTEADVIRVNEDPAYEDIRAVAGDPELEFQMSLPVNNEAAKIYGLELAVQHFFGDTGFGVMANYTLVRGDVKFDDTAPPSEDQFALLGLSDTANLVLMYDNHGIEARLAYNWRDEFLNRTNVGGYRNPGYVEAHSQIDLNVSYDVTDDISVFFEGINLTGEDRREHARNKAMLWGLEDLGARYQIGARYSF